jgi:hypothetical protein
MIGTCRGRAREARAAYYASKYASKRGPRRYRDVSVLRPHRLRERGCIARDNCSRQSRPTPPMESVRRQADRYETRVAYKVTRGPPAFWASVQK